MPVALLGASAALSLATGGLADAVVIGAVVLINAAIGFFTERSADRVIHGLGRVAHPVAGDRSAPLFIDAKITRSAAWFLEDAFAGH